MAPMPVAAISRQAHVDGRAARRDRELDPVAGLQSDTGLRRYACAQEGVGAIIVAAHDQGAAVGRSGAEIAVTVHFHPHTKKSVAAPAEPMETDRHLSVLSAITCRLDRRTADLVSVRITAPHLPKPSNLGLPCRIGS